MKVDIDDLINATHDNPVFIESGVPAAAQPPKLDDFPVYFERTFEDILLRLCDGDTLEDIVKDSTMPQNVKLLRKWIFSDDKRRERYYKSQEIGSEKLADEIIAIADGLDNPLEDVNRSALRIKARQWRVAAHNKDRYGQTRQIDATLNIDLGSALEKADRRVIDLNPADVKKLP